MTQPVLEDKDKYIHRDLSWLMFNERVLEESVDIDNPLLERTRFVAIAMNNLDEFLMVRFAGIKRLLDAQYRPVCEPRGGDGPNVRAAIIDFLRNGKGKCLELRPFGGSEKSFILAMSHGGDSLQLGEMVDG